MNFKTITLGVHKLRHNSHSVEQLLQTKLTETSCRIVGDHRHRVLGHQLHRQVAMGTKNEKVDLLDYDVDDFCELVFMAFAEISECPWEKGFKAFHDLPRGDTRRYRMSINGHAVHIVP